MERHLDFVSVMIYVGVFALSLFFANIAEILLQRPVIYQYKWNDRKRIIGFFFLGVAIFIPCIFAAFRGFDVGRDVKNYIIDYYDYGRSPNVSFGDFREQVKLKIPEILFTLLMYICCKIGSLRLLFFTIQALIMIPLAYALVNSKEKNREGILLYRKDNNKGALVLGFALYYLLFFNFSLSAMRQSIAMSLLLAAVVHTLRHRIVRAIALIVIAQMFHSSVALIVVLVLLCYIINKSNYRKVYYCFFAVLLLAAFFAFSIYAYKIADLAAIFNPRYRFFIRNFFHGGIVLSDIPITDIMIKTILVIIPVGIAFTKKKISEVDRLMLIFVFVGRYFVLFNGVFFESMRIAYYFDAFLVLYIPRSLLLVRKNNNRVLYSCIYVFFAFLYWIYYIMYVGGYSTNLVTFNI